MVFKLLVCLLISAGMVSAQNPDSTKRPILTLQSRVLPPWVIAGGVEIYALPRHSISVIFGGGYHYFFSSDETDSEKFKSFDYRFYFGLSRKNELDHTADNQTMSLLFGKRRYFDNNFNFEIYLGPAYTQRTTVERKYDEAEKIYEYNTYESSYWKLRAGFSIGCTFYSQKKNH